MAVGELMENGICDVTVYHSDDAWYGVTYSEDKEKVKSSIKNSENKKNDANGHQTSYLFNQSGSLTISR